MKNHRNIILVYKILHKSLINAKYLCIRFGKIDRFIAVYDGATLIFNTTKYLTLTLVFM